ncbi:TonB family protein [Undibacterium curvum]|uniref:TonB family protein n=1 Tax=Undibacterium curvum TaxID=2762294 RepID=A0ABR7A3E7_9BURK|nr:TonB family protein [Undibacterium curvum]MBC3931296.1 TonB family protein [Undibacterium curvum]
MLLKKIDILDHCVPPKYPKAAQLNRFHGSARVLLKIDTDGKVDAVDFLRSSGWWVLDEALAKSVVGCKILDQAPGKDITAAVSYHFRLDEKYRFDADPELIADSCEKSDLVKIADPKENGLGIVVGSLVSKTGEVQRTSLEWASGDEALDRESIRVVKSCKFNPATTAGKLYNAPYSIRLLPVSK